MIVMVKEFCFADWIVQRDSSTNPQPVPPYLFDSNL